MIFLTNELHLLFPYHFLYTELSNIKDFKLKWKETKYSGMKTYRNVEDKDDGFMANSFVKLSSFIAIVCFSDIQIHINKF